MPDNLLLFAAISYWLSACIVVYVFSIELARHDIDEYFTRRRP